MKPAIRAAYWVLPSLLCLGIYWLGLKTWFWQDDFAWLSLHLRLKQTGQWWAVLFAPMAQGTIRPLSERAFFLVFYELFGLNAAPYRMMVFATQCANLVLLSAVTRRFTGSSVAGLLAPIFWLVNIALARPMSWNSAYNQILCAFFMLLALYCALRHQQTGHKWFTAAEWISFLAGLSALETMVVYPVLALLHAFCLARQRVAKTLWMFPVAITYAAVHWYVTPEGPSGQYRMHFDAGLLSSLWTYWQWALGVMRMAEITTGWPRWLAPVGTAILSASLLGFAAWKLLHKNWLAGFFLGWFLVVLAPVLPLREHLSEYYLTIPVVGLSMLGAWAVAESLRGRWRWKVVSIAVAAAYVVPSLSATRAATRWYYENALGVRTLVRGVARAHQLHPDKLILLTGVNDDLFWTGIADRPFRLVGAKDVYLAPGSEGNITERPGLGIVSDFVLPPGPALRALEEDRAVVYAVGGLRLVNVTAAYRILARQRWSPSEEPRHVDVGNPLFAKQLGLTWHQIEGAYRWMPRRASLHLGGPSSPNELLYISGYCPAEQVRDGPLKLTVTVEGHVYPPVLLKRGNAPFEVSFPLPPNLVGKPRIEIGLEVDRTFMPSSDSRNLGLVFGTFSIR